MVTVTLPPELESFAAEAVAARRGIRPAGGGGYRETEDERPATSTASRAVELTFTDRRPRR